MKHAAVWLLVVAVICFVVDLEWLDSTKQLLVMDKQGVVQVQFLPSERDANGLDLKRWLDRWMSWFPVEVGTRLDSGARIKTLGNSTLNILLADNIACQLMPETIIHLQFIGGYQQQIFPFIEQGSLFCRIHGLNTVALADAIAIRVSMPFGRVDAVHGAFMVTHSAEPMAFGRLEVMEGSVQFKSSREGGGGALLSAGQGLELASTSPAHQVEPLSLERKAALASRSRLRLIPSFWSRMMDHWPVKVTFLAHYHDFLLGATKRDMQEIRKGVAVASAFRWGGQTPEKLTIDGVPTASLVDGWSNRYYYEKLGKNQALLVSSGRDGLLFTHDDLLLGIVL